MNTVLSSIKELRIMFDFNFQFHGFINSGSIFDKRVANKRSVQIKFWQDPRWNHLL